MNSIEQNLITDVGLLKKGDVVITNSGADQSIFELVEDPRPSAQRHQYSGTWCAGRTRYIAVKCRRPMKTVTKTNQYNNQPYTYKQIEFRMPNSNDPIEKFDFNFKNVFRIKQAAVVDNNNIDDDYFNCD
jgi:hypothetical protein